jgi:hypothetical protein
VLPLSWRGICFAFWLLVLTEPCGTKFENRM